MAAVLSAPTLGFAQSVSATVTGVVTDASGAILPDTSVELSNPTTGISFKVKTNSAGSYRFPDVPPGPNYVLTIVHDGFATTSIKSIYVNVANVRTENVQMKAGNNVEVEVQASGRDATLNTEDASLGINYQVKVLNDLPIQDRTTVARLFVLQPGVTSSGSTTGSRTDQNNKTVDGLDVNDFATGSGTTGNNSSNGFGIVGGAPVDSVQEFRATVGGFGVGSGPGSGGQFNLDTRSGTNQFHGNLNEYHRDRSTVANDWFNKLAGVARPQLIRNQFGGSLGGPILHDKLFFFVDANYYRVSSSNPVSRVVPLNSYRSGNVGYINNSSSSCGRTSRANTTPSCISYLTPAQVKAMDPAGVGINASLQTFINNAYPQANDITGGDGINTGLYRFNALNVDNRSQYVGAVDYVLTPSIKLRGVGAFTRIDSVQTSQQFPSSPVLTAPFSDRSYRWAGSMAWQIGPNKFNQLTIGRVVQDVSFPVTYNPQGINPLSFATGTTTLLAAPYKSPVNAQGRRIPILQFNDEFNWQIGRHTLTIGGSFKYITTSSNTKLDYATLGIGLGGRNTALNASLRPADINTASTASVTYDSAYAAGLGRIATVTGTYNFDKSGTALPLGTGSQRNYKYYQTLAYIGDTWKVTPALTLDYGVNYQFFSVPYEVNGLETVQTMGFNDYFYARVAQSAASRSGVNAIPFQSYVLGGAANNGPNLYQPDWKNLAPRFAFAYNPSFDRDTVFRGSIGLVFDRTVVNAVQYQQDQSSYLFSQPISVSNGVSGNARAALANDPRYTGNPVVPTPPTTPKSGFQPYVINGVPTGLQNGQAFNTTIDPNLKTPYSIMTNFTMEHSFNQKTIFRVSYVGRLGRRLLAQADANQLIDFADPASGQTMAQAMGNLTTQLRNNPKATPTVQPWFENQLSGFRGSASSNTVAVANSLGSLVSIGDFADTIQALSPYLQPNVGMGAQFSLNNYYTNKGFSSYNGLLVSVQQNMTRGLQFTANYTWQHSIDNVSLIANTNGSGGSGLLCDALRPRLCRGNSDFDITHLFNAPVTYQLPFGRGRQFGGNLPKALDEVIGGWDISGIPSWRSGPAFHATGEAYVASYSNNAPVLFNGNTAAIRRRVHKNGAALFMFDDQNAALGAFQGPIGLNIGSRNMLRGPSAFEFDAGVAKTFALYREVNLKFRADAFNALNHPVFASPSNGSTNSDIVNGSQFGQLTSATGSQPYRVLQLALRLEF
ncbi:MAG: carboxypeptidase-like regulatory domain-containing protein [Terriglobus sp.]